MKQKNSITNIVIPSAGLGSRFSVVGYKNPKPFIDIKGRIMLDRVLQNLYLENAHFYVIMMEEHIEKYGSELDKLKSVFNITFIPVNKLTDGNACTICACHRYLNNDTPLLVANVDQIVDLPMSSFIDDCKNRKLDGSILTFEANDPKWSYAKVDDKGFVTEIREKTPFSNIAHTGIYYFSKGQYFFDGTMDIIAHNDRAPNNEFFVSLVYNHLIKDGLKFGIYSIDKSQMHGIGDPNDLEYYINHIDK